MHLRGGGPCRGVKAEHSLQQRQQLCGHSTRRFHSAEALAAEARKMGAPGGSNRIGGGEGEPQSSSSAFARVSGWVARHPRYGAGWSHPPGAELRKGGSAEKMNTISTPSAHTSAAARAGREALCWPCNSGASSARTSRSS